MQYYYWKETGLQRRNINRIGYLEPACFFNDFRSGPVSNLVSTKSPQSKQNYPLLHVNLSSPIISTTAVLYREGRQTTA